MAVPGRPQRGGVSCGPPFGSRRSQPLRAPVLAGEVIKYARDDRRQAGNPYRRRQAARWGLPPLRLIAAAAAPREDRAAVARWWNRLAVPGYVVRVQPPPARRRAVSARRRRQGLDKTTKEIVRHLARSGVDQARADLSQLAADMRLHLVVQASGLGALIIEPEPWRCPWQSRRPRRCPRPRSCTPLAGRGR